MGKTSIEWTDYSWPVLNGCRRVSPGCENCYAERLSATRLRSHPKYEGLAAYGKNGPRWTGKSRLWLKALSMPLKLRKPSKIFVADMGDLFFEGNSFEDIAIVWGVMAACQRHTFQVLTKRPERMLQFFAWLEGAHVTCVEPAQTSYCVIAAQRAMDLGSDKLMSPGQWPLKNVWIGVSAESQAEADKRIPLLAQAPAALHFVSAEPLLGAIDFRKEYLVAKLGHYPFPDLDHVHRTNLLDLIDWVIVGGESGPNARACDLPWIESIVEQCAAAKTPVFVKQLGAVPMQRVHPDYGLIQMLHKRGNRKGNDMSEWPEHLRVQQFPKAA
jgi:protein gp37